MKPVKTDNYSQASAAAPDKKGFHQVNGLNMYYELYSQPANKDHLPSLVLIHGGGSTIESSFGRLLPGIVSGRQVLAMELQAHGRTADRDTPLSFEQDAADVRQLLHQLGIRQADFLGFSNGGQTALQIALNYPDLVRKLVLASMFYKRDAVCEAFWDGFEGATLEHMPAVLKEAFLTVNPDKKALQTMFDRDVLRMKQFEGWTDQQMQSIKAPTLIVQGNTDVGSLEHALEMHRLIEQSELVILPGGHGAYMGTLESLSGKKWTMTYFPDLLFEFLDRME